MPEIVLLLLCATLARAGDFVEIAWRGRKNLAFLRRFCPYAHGMPSHGTLGEVIRALDPALFKACFIAWVEGLRESEPDLIAIDGKTSRRTHARRTGCEPLHLVSAWASRQRLVLGQEAGSSRHMAGSEGHLPDPPHSRSCDRSTSCAMASDPGLNAAAGAVPRRCR